MIDDRGSWVRVEIGGIEVETTICEHHLPAVECPECDLFGGNYQIEDRTTWRQRLKDPIAWLKVRRDIYRINRRRK